LHSTRQRHPSVSAMHMPVAQVSVQVALKRPAFSPKGAQ
jgi:hypothetical protein